MERAAVRGDGGRRIRFAGYTGWRDVVFWETLHYTGELITLLSKIPCRRLR